MGLGQNLTRASAIALPDAELNHTKTRCPELVGSSLRGTAWQEQGCRQRALLSSCPFHTSCPQARCLRPRAQLTSLHPRRLGRPGSVRLDHRSPGAGGSRGPEGSGVETNPTRVKKQILVSLGSPSPPVSSMTSPTGLTGLPACLSTCQANVDHWGLHTDCPHPVGPRLTFRDFLEPKHKHRKPTKKFPVLHGALTLTQKSRLYLIFRNRPPTIAARWMTCVGRTFSNRARVCAASLGGVRPSEA